MESPITVLWGNIVHAFENADESALELHKEATKCGKLAKSIAYDNGKDKVRTPFADLKSSSRRWDVLYYLYLSNEVKCVVQEDGKSGIEYFGANCTPDSGANCKGNRGRCFL